MRTLYSQGKQSESEFWFKALVDTKKVTAWDWRQNGKRLNKVMKYREAAQSYREAAMLGGDWTNWCEASISLSLVNGEEDAQLYVARKCISEGSGKKDPGYLLLEANKNIAFILNYRGVYQEALSHAREATALRPSDSFAFHAQAEALIGLHRFQEAINVSSQAIRLSDGKYAFMHFTLASAYYSVENWQLAMQSYEKAAQLDSQNSAAAYNVALCNQRLGYFRDAAKWYEEALRRRPNHPDRQDILNRIQILRR